jgi:hypothetical protein
MVLRPGFEPGSATFSPFSKSREAAILDRTILPEHWTRLLAFAVYFHSVTFSTYPNKTRFVENATDGFSLIVVS